MQDGCPYNIYFCLNISNNKFSLQIILLYNTQFVRQITKKDFNVKHETVNDPASLQILHNAGAAQYLAKGCTILKKSD